MESSQSTIQALVNKTKEEMFTTVDFHSFVSPSAYDSAWLAMIPDPQQRGCPMFSDCLDWVLNNQKEEGFWGECGDHGIATIDCLPATLACMVALKMWNAGDKNIEKGLAFINANTERLLTERYDHCPRWFALVFPAMVELAQTTGLEVVFPDKIKAVVNDIFCHRQHILETEELVDKYHYPPLLSYLETLPSSYDINQGHIVKHLSADGSLFQSPSATARAFMATGNKECLTYLQFIVQRCDNRVPPMYPMDEELIKLCMVNQLQRLGLAEHFNEEIEDILTQVYRSYMNQESQAMDINLVPAQLYKDSLAFRLLRNHGCSVSPWMFCWFLHHEDILDHIENNCEHFSSVLFNVYRATDLMFSGEYELQEARSFSRKLLEKIISMKTSDDDNLVTFPNFQRMVKHELSLPWIARLEHLEHRMWIEENEINAQWMGKASFYRLSCLHNDDLMQLAVENYEFRQSIYKNELEELKRWSKDWGLSDMGFGREKTAYCYFAVASSTSLPQHSDLRIVIAKSAALITVTDDFFDMKGSLSELRSLTGAVQRWDGKGLSGHSKIIFDALDNLVSDIAAKYLQQQGGNITTNLRQIWYETFVSWLMETKWAKIGHIPSMDEYLDVGMTSIATHTVVLPASCLLNSSLPSYKLWPAQYETITKLLMVMARLLNDTQSYERELEDGKMNLVSLYLKENPEVDIEDSIAFVRELLDERKKEFLEHVLMDGLSDLPKPCKHLHLSCFKVFQMFFNSSNRFDSDTEMVHDIQKAIYIPLKVRTSRPLKPLSLHVGPKVNSIINTHFGRTFKHHSTRIVATHSIPLAISMDGYGKKIFQPKFKFSFI